MPGKQLTNPSGAFGYTDLQTQLPSVTDSFLTSAAVTASRMVAIGTDGKVAVAATDGTASLVVGFAPAAISSGYTGLVVTGGIGCNGAYVNNGIITPTQLTANTNDYAPTNGLGAHKMRISSNAAINITGLTNGVDGREVILSNIGAFSITLTHDATSTAANRFYCPNNANYVLRKNGSALIWYDAPSQRWRVVAA